MRPWNTSGLEMAFLQWIPEWPNLRVPALPTRTTPSDLAGPTAWPPAPSQGLQPGTWTTPSDLAGPLTPSQGFQPSTWLVPGGRWWVSELEAGKDKAPPQSRVPQPLENHKPKLSTMDLSGKVESELQVYLREKHPR